ncbi:tetratricopeptide repeat protein [Sphingosinicellaceae bacterium]|nr:tetratricopeptide repeat protein [Sphingosinicellaceae bacterium]
MKLLLMVAALATAMPVLAQNSITVPSDPVIVKRIGKLESEMKAVQRKVFPGGDPRFFEPEVQPAAPAPTETVGTPATAPLTDLTARVGELEAQLRTLTGQVEANQFKVRQLEDGLAKFKGDAEFRLSALEGNGPKPAPQDAGVGASPAPNDTAPVVPEKPEAAPGPKTVEEQWRSAYALVVAKKYADAETALTDFLSANPKAVRASDAQYWLGKSYASDKQHAAAAKAFLDGYQKYPKGARAPDSLLGLSQALIDLKKPAQACQSLGELDAVYGAKLSPALKAQAEKARTAAKCKA